MYLKVNQNIEFDHFYCKISQNLFLSKAQKRAKAIHIIELYSICKNVNKSTFFIGELNILEILGPTLSFRVHMQDIFKRIRGGLRGRAGPTPPSELPEGGGSGPPKEIHYMK